MRLHHTTPHDITALVVVILFLSFFAGMHVPLQVPVLRPALRAGPLHNPSGLTVSVKCNAALPTYILVMDSANPLAVLWSWVGLQEVLVSVSGNLSWVGLHVNTDISLRAATSQSRFLTSAHESSVECVSTRKKSRLVLVESYQLMIRCSIVVKYQAKPCKTSVFYSSEISGQAVQDFGVL